MLGWALFCLVLALIAAVLGFGGLAGAFVGFAKILFFVTKKNGGFGVRNPFSTGPFHSGQSDPSGSVFFS